MSRFAAVELALADIAAGRPVVVVDDEGRENEGDLVLAAELATSELLAFVVRHTSGFVCVALPGADCDRLDLPPMRAVNEDARGTAYTVTVDARHGIATGISAADRARTIRLLADPATGPADLTRPGHVVPLRARSGGVLERPGHTEATVDLCRLAGLRPAGALCELVDDDGGMMRLPALTRFTARHGLTLLRIDELIAYRKEREGGAALVVPVRPTRSVEPVASVRLPTRHGAFRAVGYRAADGAEHVALVLGDVDGGDDLLVRVHSECLTGDALGSLRCDCGPQLDAALAAVAARGRGVVVYLRGHEGRGIGLLAKLRAYELQEGGADTVEANVRLGLPVDARDYRAAAEILRDLGVRSVQLLTNNPAKLAGLSAGGVRVRGRVPLSVAATTENHRYLRTKRDRMGHYLPAPAAGSDAELVGPGTVVLHRAGA
ncbi:MAG: bifunctional 3,4-dihydroxy-2-butanone-4-phosphate synthase/GTP cyclohydrolase II [Frankiaceae bacterium]